MKDAKFKEEMKAFERLCNDLNISEGLFSALLEHLECPIFLINPETLKQIQALNSADLSVTEEYGEYKLNGICLEINELVPPNYIIDKNETLRILQQRKIGLEIWKHK